MGFKQKVPRKVGTCKHCIIREGKEEVQKEQREFYIDNLLKVLPQYHCI
jgi:hypothetical protein